MAYGDSSTWVVGRRLLPSGLRLCLALVAAMGWAVEASETRTVGPFQLVFHQQGESYGGKTADRNWTAAQIEAAQRAAQSWVDRIGNTAATGSVPLHLMQADLGGADPITGSIVIGQSSNPLGPTSATARGTLEEQAWRDGRTTGLASPGLLVLNSNSSVVLNADESSASLTAAGRLQRVLAHEIGHSIGIYGTGVGGTFTAPYTAYDALLRDAQGHSAGPSFDPVSQVTWAGTLANALYGTSVPIYAPTTFAAGSSLYHVDILNQLMNYRLGNTSNAIRGASALEMAMLQDMGWQLNATDFDVRLFADTHDEILNDDDLTANVTSGVALQIVNGGGTGDSLRRITQNGDIAVGQIGSIGVGLWSNYNRLVNHGAITATGDYNAAIYCEGTGNTLQHVGTLEVTGAEATGILAVGSNNLVFNTGTVTARLAADGAAGNAIRFYGGGSGNAVYLQRGSAIMGNLQTDAAAGLSFGEGVDALGTGDSDFRLVFLDRTIGAWEAVFWGGATALGCRDPAAAANQFASVEIKSQAALTTAADMEVTGPVVVRSGGRLAGTATITTPLLDSQPGATLMPGDVADADGLPAKAIGTMTIGGNLSTSGNVEWDLTWRQPPTAEADRIAVTGGTAAINASARGTFAFTGEDPSAAENYDIARRYTILTTDASDGLAISTRPEVTDNLAARRIILRTDQCVYGFSRTGQTYYAYTGRDASFAQLGRTANEQAVGAYLDTVKWLDDGTFGTATADLQWVRDTLDLMPDEADVARALNQMTGEIYASLGTIGSQRMFLAYHRLAERVREHMFRGPCEEPGDAATACGEPQAPRSFGWLAGHGAGGPVHSNGNAQAYDFSSAGLQLGVGYQIDDRLALGAFYDYDSLGLDDEFANQGNVATHDFGGFASYRADVSYLLLAAGGGVGHYDVTRTIILQNPVNVLARQVQGDHEGSQWGMYGELGRSFGQGPTGLRPYLGLLYTGVHQNAFRETGGGIADLGVEAETTTGLRLLLGSQLDLRLPMAIDTVFTLRGAWMHELLADTAGLATAGFAGIPGGPTFTVQGVDLGRDWAVLGTELRTNAWRNVVHLYGNYDLVLGSRQQLHVAGGGLDWVW